MCKDLVNVMDSIRSNWLVLNDLPDDEPEFYGHCSFQDWLMRQDDLPDLISQCDLYQIYLKHVLRDATIMAQWGRVS